MDENWKKNIFILWILIFTCVLLTDCCPTYSSYAYAGHKCVWVTSTYYNAFDSNVECSKYGGELAVPEEADNTFLFDTFGSNFTDGLWIGVIQNGSTSIYSTFSGGNLTYVNWDIDQPLNDAESQCVVMQNETANMTWMNIDCHCGFKALCQRILDICPLGSIYDLETQQYPLCYWFTQNSTKIANESQAECALNGGSLTVFTGQSQVDYIVTHYSSLFTLGTIAWIGINDIVEEGVYKTWDGTVVTWFNWEELEPNNLYDEDCVQMSWRFKWHDVDCVSLYISSRGFCFKEISILTSTYNIGVSNNSEPYVCTINGIDETESEELSSTEIITTQTTSTTITTAAETTQTTPTVETTQTTTAVETTQTTPTVETTQTTTAVETTETTPTVETTQTTTAAETTQTTPTVETTQTPTATETTQTTPTVETTQTPTAAETTQTTPTVETTQTTTAVETTQTTTAAETTQTTPTVETTQTTTAVETTETTTAAETTTTTTTSLIPVTTQSTTKKIPGENTTVTTPSTTPTTTTSQTPVTTQSTTKKFPGENTTVTTPSTTTATTQSETTMTTVPSTTATETTAIALLTTTRVPVTPVTTHAAETTTAESITTTIAIGTTTRSNPIQQTITSLQPVSTEAGTAYPASITTETVTQEGLNCTCYCPVVTRIEDFTIVLKELMINHKETSAYKRKRISVYEDRPSARNMGLIGICVLCVTMLIIVILDASTLWLHCNDNKRAYSI